MTTEPDRTTEVDALDILEASIIAAEPPRSVLPQITTPPRRVSAPSKRARSVLMLAAALGTWGFFASFAIGGVYGVVQIAKHFSSHETPITIASAQAAPATDSALTQESAALAPLLEVDANQLARVSSDTTNASIDVTPRASTISAVEIFRRPSKTQVGVLRVSSSVKGLLVDGTPERVTGGSIILACGDHRIRPPHQTARVVRVPCGKTVTL